MAGDSLVKVKCKACGFEWEQRRLPRRCANCKAYLAVVGCEILSRSRGKVAPKKLAEAKEPKMGPKEEPKAITDDEDSSLAGVESEPKPAPKPAPKPKPPAQTPKKFELEPSNKAQIREIREKKETYDCGKCGAKITKDMKKCAGCGVELNWDDIYE